MHLTWMRNRTWKNRIGARASRTGSAGPRLFRAGHGWCRGKLAEKDYTRISNMLKLIQKTDPPIHNNTFELITSLHTPLPASLPPDRSSHTRHTARSSPPFGRAFSLAQRCTWYVCNPVSSVRSGEPIMYSVESFGLSTGHYHEHKPHPSSERAPPKRMCSSHARSRSIPVPTDCTLSTVSVRIRFCLSSIFTYLSLRSALSLPSQRGGCVLVGGDAPDYVQPGGRRRSARPEQ
jgi:hypothetical protein